MTDFCHPFLFEGEFVGLRLSNEIWLSRECPLEFRGGGTLETAPWIDYVRALRGNMAGCVDHWQHESPHVEVPREIQDKSDRHVCIHCNQRKCFWRMHLSPTTQLSEETIVSVQAWMLHCMLVAVPSVITRCSC